MKNFLVSILAVLYLGLSSRATIDVHYCMDKLLGVDFNHPTASAKKCNNCGMEELTNVNTCCRDEDMALSLERVQNVSSFHYQFVQTSSEIVLKNSIHISPSLITKLSSNSFVSLDTILGKSKIPSYLLNRVICI